MKRKHQGQDSLCKEKCLNLNANVYLFACKLDISVSIRDSGDVREDDSVASTQMVTASRDAPSPACGAWSPVAAAEARAAVGYLCALPVQLVWMVRMSQMSLPAQAQARESNPLSIQSVRSGDPSQWGAGAFASRAVLWPPWWADLAHPAHT